jgi:two-component system CheB/CheR fusion protein
LGSLGGLLARYGGAVFLVAAAFLLRQKISAAAGPLPLYITFVPVLLVAALLWGMRAGLLATGTAVILSWYWTIPAVGQFRIERASHVVGLVLFAATGTSISAIAHFYQRARQRAATFEDEAKYHLLFRNMPDGFAHCRMLFDDAGRPIDFVYLDVNDSFTKLTGLNDVAGKRVTEVIPGIRESNPELFQIYGRVASGGRPERIETYLQPLGIWFSVVVYSPRKDHFVAVFDNITKRKQDEETLRRSEADLKEADLRKNEFMAMLSHELRNPLAPIRNSLYIMERAVPGGEQAKRAQQTIDRQTAHLTRLVDELLDVTRISRGKINLRRESLDLCELVRRTTEDHRSLFAQNGVRLEVHTAGQRLWVNGDPTRLTQVLGNLLQNAAKFTARGGSTSVSVAADPSAGEALIHVRDTGVGVSAEMLAHLFEPFAQADKTLDRSRGGLGLGLTLVKNLVELHGGKVEGSSGGEGSGAEFTVRLPLERQEAEPVSAGAATEPAPLHRQRVLLIEDNVDAAESLGDALKLSGYEVAVAFDGFRGIEKAREFKPDVVFCDIGLPGMDGYQVARAFRSDAALGKVFLAALTGYASSEDQQRAAEAGFARHLAKPASLQMLEEVITSLPS